MPELRLTWDAETDVAYLCLRATGPRDVLGPTLLLEHEADFGGFVAADYLPADGRLTGFEFQMASTCLPVELLASAERSDGTNLERRMEERLLRRLVRDFTSGD